MAHKSPVTDGPIEEDDYAIDREDQQDEYEFNRKMVEAQGMSWTWKDEQEYWNK